MNSTELSSILEALTSTTPVPVIPRGGTLLLVASDEQKRMLARYGSTTYLDATYKVNKWGFAFFMVVVVDEHRRAFPCAYFIIQHERTECVGEALAYLKHLVPNWNPTTIITDKADEDINACRAVFPNVLMILCEFHAKQAWLRWLRTSAHGVAQAKQKQVYNVLNDIMKTPTVAIANLKVRQNVCK